MMSGAAAADVGHPPSSSSSASPCELSKDSYDSSRKVLKVLGKTVRQNYFMLLLALGFTVVTMLVIIYIVYKIIDSVRIYYKYHARTDRARFTQKDADDYIYKAADEAEGGGGGVPADEYAAIRSKIEAIKSGYSGYNEEMRLYARNVLGREPDDLMNEDILARKHDDYKYDDDE